MKSLLSCLVMDITTGETLTDATTTSNVLLDENGQFVDPSQAASNIVSWWEELDIVNKLIEKIPTLILAASLIIIGVLLSKLVAKLITKTMSARGVDPSVYNFIRRIVCAAIKLTFVLSALSMFINVGSVIAAIGAAGVTAGLGLQASVAQFASGIQILMNRPFKTGDFVELNGVSGNVADIRFMNTVIITPDNKRIIIPNSHITSNHIINYTAEGKRRLDLIFSISYSDDITKAKDVIRQTALHNEFILSDPEPQVYVNSHESSSINLIAKIWCSVDKYWDAYHSMQEQVKIALDRNAISIPFNQLDVHVISGK